MVKCIFAGIILVHGLIHFMGFAKAFGYGNITQLTRDISKPAGFFWFITALLFTAGMILFLVKKESWPVIVLIAVVISQILIITVWKDAKFGTLANAIALLVVIPSYANMQFTKMAAVEAKTILAKIPESNKVIITNEMLSSLPPVVQKWLIRSGVIGKEKMKTVRLKQKGEMRTKPEGKWMDFEAKQYFTVNEPAFVWTADVHMMPLVTLKGRDKFEQGRGAMFIKLLALVKVADAKNTEKVNSATMIRYLSETSWFPAAALSNYIKWETIDSLSAKATMTFNGMSVSGIFRFTNSGDMVGFTADRYYGTDDSAALEKWVVETEDWKDFAGIRIPYKSKVTWKLKAGDFNWAKMELTDLEFNKTELYQ
jgi:hypothetical protein